MANLNAGDILNTVNSILGAAASQNGGTSQSGAANPAAGLNFGDLGALAEVIRNTNFLDAEKLEALKTGLLSLAAKSKLSPSVLLKLAPLVAALQTVRPAEAVPDTGAAEAVPDANQKAWDLIKPFLDDKDKLASLLPLFGEYGGKLLGILKAVFLRA
ncbi:MAG: hypothetical protein IKO14_07600 [Oscillibacter sp.]|nr:hypothetical protein [Oscillibacter sp.]